MKKSPDSSDNEKKIEKSTEPEAIIRSGKTISEAELRQWLAWKSLKILDMLAENRDICLCAHASSEKESAGGRPAVGSGPSASLLKEANQAAKISLDVLEILVKSCKIAETPDPVSDKDKARALRRKILSTMKGTGNHDAQAEL